MAKARRTKPVGKATRATRQALAQRTWPTPQDIDREIDARIAAYKAAAGTQAAEKRLNLIVLGDSWFDYPVGDDDHPAWSRTDIAIWLEEDLIKPKPRVAHLAHWGDAMQDLIGIKKVRRLLKAFAARPADAILFSGGGNDIIGEKLHKYLNDADAVGNDPAMAINEKEFQVVLDSVASDYRKLIAIRDEHAFRVPILIHGYDFARPTNVGICLGAVGPWLFPAFEMRGWRKEPEGKDLQAGLGIVRQMLLRFDRLQRDIAATSQRVIVVETQGTIKQPGLWHNETHLKAEGFKQIAERFAAALAKHFQKTDQIA